MSTEVSLTNNITLTYEWEDGQAFDASQLVFLVQTKGNVGPPIASFGNSRKFAGSGNTVSISTFDSASIPQSNGPNNTIFFSTTLNAGWQYRISSGFDQLFGTFDRVATPSSQNIAVGSSTNVLQPAAIALTSLSFAAACELLIALGGITTGAPNYDVTVGFTLAFTVSYNGLPQIPKKSFTVDAVTPALDGNLAAWPYVGHLVSGAPVYDGLNPTWQMVVDGRQHVAMLTTGSGAPNPSPEPVPVGVTPGGMGTPRVIPLTVVEIRNVPAGSTTQDFSNLLTFFAGATTLLTQILSVGCYVANVYVFLPYADNTSLAAEQILVIPGQQVFGGEVHTHASLTIGPDKLPFNVAISLEAIVTLNGAPLPKATVTSGIAQPMTTGGTPLKLTGDFSEVTNSQGQTAVDNGELPFIHRWVTLTFQGNHGLVTFNWDGSSTGGTMGIVHDGPDPYEATLAVTNSGNVTLTDGSTEALRIIGISVVGGPAFVKTGTQAGYQPTIRGAISLATGGSSRLLLACVRSYVEANYTLTTLPGQPAMLQVDAKYTSSAVRMCISSDFGETFKPAVDIGAESYFDGNPISDGRFGEASGGVLPSLPIPIGSYPKPSFCLPVINQLLVLPHGRIYANGTHQGTNPINDWAAARLTDDVTGQSGWRDSQTPNEKNQVTQLGITGSFPNGGAGNAWLTSGSAQSTKGGGGKSGGPTNMRGAMTAFNRFFSSADGGDTWQVETPPTPPTGFQLFGRGRTTDAVIYQKGQAYDGKNYSSTGFEGWSFYQPGPGNYINLQAVGVASPPPFNLFALARSGEGEIVRAIVLSVTRSGALALASARYGFGTGYQLPNPTQAPGGFLRTGVSGIPPGTYKVGFTLLSTGVQGPIGETEISPLNTWVIPGSPSTVNQIVNFLPLPSGVGSINGRPLANMYCSDAPGSSTLRLVGTVTAADLGTFVIDALPASNAPEPPASNSTGPILAPPPKTLLYQGTYWDYPPADIMVSPTEDGQNLFPLIPKVPQFSSMSIAAWAWTQRIVMGVAIDDTIAVYKTENGGQWWVGTCWSKSNFVTCETGLPPS